MEEEIERFRSLVITALPYDAARGDSLTMTSAPFLLIPSGLSAAMAQGSSDH